jgi:hypothetical protein
MPSSFRTVSSGWRAVLRSPGVQRATDGGAQGIVDRAKQLVPPRGKGITGRYEASLKVAKAASPFGAESHAVADVPYAAAIEAKYNTLGRSLHGGAR